ncbi:jg4117 [Pararge aegeria aegeria]|uniref:Jg4117 protein n=1 Tax=Pararge aegeria aegeria TaxID=348720 RepID=A0A8S4RTW5_9NEOP|nr:jg4117 [Pararge aegeria aegeria]
MQCRFSAEISIAEELLYYLNLHSSNSTTYEGCRPLLLIEVMLDAPAVLTRVRELPRLARAAKTKIPAQLRVQYNILYSGMNFPEGCTLVTTEAFHQTRPEKIPKKNPNSHPPGIESCRDLPFTRSQSLPPHQEGRRRLMGIKKNTMLCMAAEINKIETDRNGYR